MAVFVVLSLCFGGDLLAQGSGEVMDKIQEVRGDSLLDDVLFNDDELVYYLDVKKSYRFLYWRSNYDSRTFFAGREIGTDQHNFSSQLYYLHSKGIYAGVSGAWYSQLDPGYRTTVLTMGYGKSLKKMNFLRLRLSYDYFIFNNDIPDFEPLYTSGVDAGITLKSKILGTRFDSYFLLGKETGTQLTWNAYGNIDLFKLGRHGKMKVEPQAALYFGSEMVEYQLNEALIDPLTNIEYTSFYKDEFGLMNIQFKLPLNINYKSFDFEASWIYNAPQTMNDGFSYPDNFFLRFSVGYIVSL